MLAPRVTPARVNGGGGGRSELVITWEVCYSLLLSLPVLFFFLVFILAAFALYEGVLFRLVWVLEPPLHSWGLYVWTLQVLSMCKFFPILGTPPPKIN